MFISRVLKDKNIAEYLIYMWQVEDLIRANDFDIKKIDEHIISKFNLDEAQGKEMLKWYEDRINMMKEEGVIEKVHLQINKHRTTWLTDLHLLLLSATKFPY